MFEFLSPLFLIGLLSAAIPLVIHLSRSRRTRKMQFSTTRFFTDQFLRSYRMSRLKELLLLFFRMALFALFAMALARPLLLPPGQSLLLGQSRSMVLLIDNSASMGYSEDGQTLLDRAKAAARELVDGLRSGDTAAIVLAGRRSVGPEILFDQPTPELGDVRQAIDNLQVSPLGTDLTAALAAAERIARSSSAQSKEIYVLSDLQASGWLAQTEAAGESEVLLFLVRVQPRQTENLAVTAVQYAASRPMVGAPFAIQPHVLNAGGRVRECDVSLWIDGQQVGQRHIAPLQGGRWAVPRFHHTFARGGWHTGHVELQDPALDSDNRRYFAFNVVDRVDVLAVNGAPSQVARLDELFFFKTALTASSEGESPMHLETISPAALAQTDLAKYRAVILANVESLAGPAVEKLEAFVDRGGSVLTFLGDRVQQNFYNQTLAAPTRLHGGLLPGRLLGIEGNPAARQEDLFVSEIDFTHPALSSFDDPAFARLTGVPMKALWTVDPGQWPVLMRVNSGSPLLIERPFGKGRVLLYAGPCDRDWSSFPVRPAYLPWVYRLTGYLAQEPIVRQPFYSTGDTVPIPVSASEGLAPVLVRTPDQLVRQATAGDDPATPLVFADTLQPGVYTLFAAGKESQGQRFVVNLEGPESNLTYLDREFAAGPGDESDSVDRVARPERSDGRGESRAGVTTPFAKPQGVPPNPEEKIVAGFREMLGGRPLVYYVDSPLRVMDASVGARRGIKLWDLLLWAALAVALVEPWLANRISLRHYAAPAGRDERRHASPLPLDGRGAGGEGGLNRFSAAKSPHP